MQTVENRIANNSVWVNLEKKLNGSGYYNPRTGVFVAEQDAFEYMIEIIRGDPDRADDVMEYFYQNWIKED